MFEDRSVPYLSLGNGNGPSDDQSRRCQPAGVRPSRPARSSDSSATPRRSFWTARESRSLRPRQHRARGQKLEHLLLETASLAVLELGNDLQVGRLRVGRDQLQIHRRRCRRGPVLAGEHQVFPGAPEVEVRVAEGMDVTGAAQPLTGGDSPRGVLSRVMHQQDRQVELPLQRAKVRQQLGHFAGVVLVDAVQSHQGIEQQQPGPEPPGRLQQPRAVRIAIEPEQSVR